MLARPIDCSFPPVSENYACARLASIRKTAFIHNLSSLGRNLLTLLANGAAIRVPLAMPEDTCG
jgi:hypothetical protein